MHETETAAERPIHTERREGSSSLSTGLIGKTETGGFDPRSLQFREAVLRTIDSHKGTFEALAERVAADIRSEEARIARGEPKPEFEAGATGRDSLRQHRGGRL